MTQPDSRTLPFMVGRASLKGTLHPKPTSFLFGWMDTFSLLIFLHFVDLKKKKRKKKSNVNTKLNKNECLMNETMFFFNFFLFLRPYEATCVKLNSYRLYFFLKK